MNIIDQKFNDFHYMINQLTEQDIMLNIKNNFSKVDPSIQKSMEDYFKKFPYWGTLSIENKDFNQIEQKAKTLKQNINDYKWLYDHLKDYRSKKLLLAILRNFYYYDFKTLEETIEHTYKHYFDLDLVRVDQNEVVVDLGAYTGDTIDEYIETYGENSYQKIYAYEITPNIVAHLKEKFASKENIICKHKAISNSNKIVYIENNSTDASANTIQLNENGTQPIESVTLDEDIKENITLIKMDIEGSEQQAIEGAKEHIKKTHPKLLLSVYHNNEDLYKIPQMINDIEPGYQFYLRNHGGPIYPTEIVLIAIYPEIK